jgi:hypothetical protein
MSSELMSILSRLEAESSLSAVVRSYEAVLERPLKNKFYAWLGFVGAGFAALLYWFFGGNYKLVDLTLGSLVGFALSFSGVSLGLGLAGLSIYSSSLKPNVLLAMVRADYPSSKKSLLSMILASFVYAIIAFLRLFSICAVYYVFISSNSFINEMILLLFVDQSKAGLFISLFFFPLFVYQIVFAFSTLWSFIYNLHLTFITVASAEIALLLKGK